MRKVFFTDASLFCLRDSPVKKSCYRKIIPSNPMIIWGGGGVEMEYIIFLTLQL
jgi:hypothetical protein